MEENDEGGFEAKLRLLRGRFSISRLKLLLVVFHVAAKQAPRDVCAVRLLAAYGRPLR